MKRKKKIVNISVLILVILAVAILLNRFQWVKDDTIIIGSGTETFTDKKIENITVISNRLFISDKAKFVSKIIQVCTDNTLPKGIQTKIKFSTDMGYPNEVIITVFTNERAMEYGEQSFKIIYAQDSKYNYQYDIKHNPEKFKIDIE